MINIKLYTKKDCPACTVMRRIIAQVLTNADCDIRFTSRTIEEGDEISKVPVTQIYDVSKTSDKYIIEHIDAKDAAYETFTATGVITQQDILNKINYIINLPKR